MPGAFRLEGNVRGAAEQGQVEAQRSYGSFGIWCSGRGQWNLAARRGCDTGWRPYGKCQHVGLRLEARAYVGGSFLVGLRCGFRLWRSITGGVTLGTVLTFPFG